MELLNNNNTQLHTRNTVRTGKTVSGLHREHHFDIIDKTSCKRILLI